MIVVERFRTPAIILIAVCIGSVLLIGSVSAASISWEDQGGYEVTEGEEITVTISGSVGDSGEIRLMRGDPLIESEIESRSISSFWSSSSITFTVGEDVDVSGGDNFHIYAEVEEDGWLGDSATTGKSYFSVKEPDEKGEITSFATPSGELNNGDTAEVDITIENTGDAEETFYYGTSLGPTSDGTNYIQEDGSVTLSPGEQTTESFSEGVSTDWIEDDNYKAHVNLWKSTNKDGLLDSQSDYDFSVDIIETEVEWDQRPPNTIEPSETVRVDVTGGAAKSAEVCLYEKGGWSDNKIGCHDKSSQGTFAFSESFDESDLEANPGETTDIYWKIEEDGWGGSTATTSSESLFIENREYDISVDSSSGGGVSGAPTNPVEEGEEITLTATSNHGYKFESWSGDYPTGEQNSKQITLTADENKNIKANFEKIEGDLTIDVRHGDKNGNQANEVNGLIVWQDDTNGEPYKKFEGTNPTVAIEQRIHDLPGDHDYKVTAYIHDQYAGATDWINIKDSDKSRTITVEESVWVKPQVFYDDGTTPLEGAYVEIKSHEGTVWRGDETASDGITEPEKLWLYPTNKGYYEIVAHYEGEKVATKRLSSLDQTREVSLETDLMSPVKLSGQVTHATFDDGIESNIYIDGDKVTATDENGNYDVELTEPGEYTVKYEAVYPTEGYETVERTISVDGEDITEDVELAATKKDIQFAVSKRNSIEGYDPIGDKPIDKATVSINGETYSVDDDGDVELSLGAGEYEYTVDADGYESLTDTLTVRNGKGKHIESTPLVKEGVGAIDLEVVDDEGNDISPIYYELYANDKKLSLNQRGQTLLDAGEYTITAEGDGENYGTSTKTVAIIEGKTTKTKIKLKNDIDGSLELGSIDTGEFRTGDTVAAELTVINTGSIRNEFLIEGSLYHSSNKNGDPIEEVDEKITLDPGESKTQTVSWTIPSNVPTGNYNAVFTLWKNEEKRLDNTKIGELKADNIIKIQPYEAKFTTFDYATYASSKNSRGGGLSDNINKSVADKSGYSNIYLQSAAAIGAVDSASQATTSINKVWKAPKDGEYTVTVRYNYDGEIYHEHYPDEWWLAPAVEGSGAVTGVVDGITVYDATSNSEVTTNKRIEEQARSPSAASQVTSTAIDVISLGKGSVIGKKASQGTQSLTQYLGTKKATAVSAQHAAQVGAEVGSEPLADEAAGHVFDDDRNIKFDANNKVISTSFDATEGHEYILSQNTHSSTSTLGLVAGGAVANISVETNVESITIKSGKTSPTPPEIETSEEPPEYISSVEDASIEYNLDSKYEELETSHRVITDEGSTSWSSWQKSTGTEVWKLSNSNVPVENGEYIVETKVRDPNTKITSNGITSRFVIDDNPPEILLSNENAVDEEIEFGAKSAVPISKIEFEYKNQGTWSDWKIISDADSNTVVVPKGAKMVRGRATDLSGLTGDWESIEIKNSDSVSPNAVINSPSSVLKNEKISFDGSDSTDNNDVASYEWDIDDDGNYEKSDNIISHSYGNTGIKVITLRVSDVAGNTDTDSVKIDVTAPEPANFDVSIQGTNEPITAGNSLEVKTKIENTGDKTATKTVELDVPNVGDDSASLTLSAGQSTTRTLSIATTEGDAGSPTVMVSSDDDSASTRVTINDQSDPENQKPVADNLSLDTTEGTPIQSSFDATDPDGDELTYTVISGPSNGQVTTSSDSFEYTPAEGYSGSDSFKYRVKDGNGGNDTAIVSITVNPSGTSPLVSLSDRSTTGLSETTMTATLDEAPNGLTGFQIEVAPKDGEIAEIQRIEEADISLIETEIKQDGSAEITATDFNKEIGSGASNIDLFDIRFAPQQFGTTDVDLTVNQMDNTAGEAINPQTSAGTLDVGQGPPPLPDQASAPRDPNGDGVYEDVYGNGRVSFSDAVLLAKQLDSKAVNQHKSQFDFIGNGRVSFADAVELANIAADGVDQASAQQPGVQTDQIASQINQTEDWDNSTSKSNGSATTDSTLKNNSTVGDNIKHYNETTESGLNNNQSSNTSMEQNETIEIANTTNMTAAQGNNGTQGNNTGITQTQRNSSNTTGDTNADQLQTSENRSDHGTTETQANLTATPTEHPPQEQESNSLLNNSTQTSTQSTSTGIGSETGGDGA